MKKVLMLDAFKPEYLKYAPYLKSLTKKYAHGRLKIPMGFVRGMDVFFNGQSNILAKFKRSGNLSWTKYFYWLGKFPLAIIINTIRLLKNNKEYFWLYNIPLKKLRYFDVCIKKPLHEGKKCKYKRIGKLDPISHKYGTKSKETIKCIKEIDNIIKKEEFDILLSDHGMIDIKETISVPRTDICFIDGTMARYWDKKPKINLKKGKWIKGNEEYGKYIFLANPGILIFPNFWNQNPDKGMHGYSSTCKEMDGFYLIQKEGGRKDISIEELNKILIKEVGYKRLFIDSQPT